MLRRLQSKIYRNTIFNCIQQNREQWAITNKELSYMEFFHVKYSIIMTTTTEYITIDHKRSDILQILSRNKQI